MIHAGSHDESCVGYEKTHFIHDWRLPRFQGVPLKYSPNDLPLDRIVMDCPLFFGSLKGVPPFSKPPTTKLQLLVMARRVMLLGERNEGSTIP